MFDDDSVEGGMYDGNLLSIIFDHICTTATSAKERSIKQFDVDAVSVLLDAGAAVNGMENDCTRKTPLVQLVHQLQFAIEDASFMYWKELMIKLLQAGAIVSDPVFYPRTMSPLDYALQSNPIAAEIMLGFYNEKLEEE